MSTDDVIETARNRRLVPGLLGVVAFAALVWLLPAGGSSCDDISRCRSSVMLDLSDLTEVADDWEVPPAGMTLSPNERHVAVVLLSPEKLQFRLAVFSTTTGEMLSSLGDDGETFFANPVYSNDGQRIAAATATYRGESPDSGEVTIWDTATLAVQQEFWSWTSDPAGPLTDNEFYWQDCIRDIGFSNDGLYLSCGGFVAPAEVSQTDSDDLVYASDYEPGFNALPAGEGYTAGRVVYDPEVTFPATVQTVDKSTAVEVSPVGPRSRAVLEIGRPGWKRTAVALNGDSTLALVARGWGGSFVDGLWPRFTRPGGDLTVVRVEDGGLVESFDLPVRPSSARFGPSGESFGVLATDMSFWLFDTPEVS